MKKKKLLAQEIEREEAQFKRIRSRVRALITSLEAQARKIGSVKTSHSQSRLEAEALLNHTIHRQDRFYFAQDKLLFGKIELESGEEYYIGKVGLNDESHEKLMVDWRAPLASKYYQASHVKNLGVAKKRVIQVDATKILNLYDEVFHEELVKTPIIESTDSQLLNELNRKRTGRMGEIVSTLQSEQDRIMRIPDSGPLIVDGPPGTGKTVIALHRAAFLLYNNRDRVGDKGVLVIGPNNKFLDYIGNVLPSLGEDEVNLRETTSLIQSPRELRSEREYSKSNKAMFKALEEITSNLPILPSKNVEFELIGEKITFSSSELHEILAQARHQKESYNSIREIFLSILISQSVDKLILHRELEEVDDIERFEIAQELRENSNYRKIANSLYLPYTPERLLFKLSKNDNFLKALAGSYYAKVKDIFAPCVERYRNLEYSKDDLFILDYLNEFLGEANVSYVDQPDFDWNRTLIGFDSKIYSHIIVDEAQDLTYLEWVSLSNRLGVKSMTIVGDWGQKSAPTELASWEDVVRILGKNVGGRVEKLSINYRTPKEIMDYALKVAGPSYDREITSLRSIENSLTFLELTDGKQVLEFLASKGEECLVIGKDYTLPIECKGLEYDEVVVINPREVISLYGREAYFVALTRATQKLTIVEF